MIENWIDLSRTLSYAPISNSVPTRLHCGGSTDHRLTGLLCRSWKPVTTNIAIDLRAKVSLRSNASGRISIDIAGVGKQEFSAPMVPMSGPFALVSAVVCYFGVHGLSIEIQTEFPFQSGLGGSGAVTVALVGAITAALESRAPGARQYPKLIRIAHNLEDSLLRNTGMQDQAAALYGGANLWEWQYSDRLNFRRRRLAVDLASMGERLLVAYTGRPHFHSQDGSRMVDRFRESGAIDRFIQISGFARTFALSLESGDYRSAGRALTADFELRSTLVPVVSSDDVGLINIATETNCGASLTGSGGGGCVWAIGETADIAELKVQWSELLQKRGFGSLLPVNTTRTGLSFKIGPAGASSSGTQGRKNGRRSLRN